MAPLHCVAALALLLSLALHAHGQSCTNGMVVQACVTACPPTCANPSPNCTLPCIPNSCGCPNGTVLENQFCISPSQCGAACVYGEWSAFDACPVTCGGSFYRERKILISAVNASACPIQERLIPCAQTACPVDCQVSNFTDAGPCSSSCGNGSKLVTRRVLVPASNGGKACPELQAVVACNGTACLCPTDKVWSECGANCVGTCSSPFPYCGDCVMGCVCPTGSVLGGADGRTCQPITNCNNANGPLKCRDNPCSSRQVCADTPRVCNGTAACPQYTCTNPPPAAVDCVVGEWQISVPCTVDCGGGFQVETRQVLTAPRYGGRACPVLSRVRDCNTGVCTTLPTTGDCPPGAVLLSCRNPCMATCTSPLTDCVAQNCTAGCQCPTGQVFLDGECKRSSRCPALPPIEYPSAPCQALGARDVLFLLDDSLSIPVSTLTSVKSFIKVLAGDLAANNSAFRFALVPGAGQPSDFTANVATFQTDVTDLFTVCDTFNVTERLRMASSFLQASNASAVVLFTDGILPETEAQVREAAASFANISNTSRIVVVPVGNIRDTAKLAALAQPSPPNSLVPTNTGDLDPNDAGLRRALVASLSCATPADRCSVVNGVPQTLAADLCFCGSNSSFFAALLSSEQDRLCEICGNATAVCAARVPVNQTNPTLDPIPTLNTTACQPNASIFLLFDTSRSISDTAFAAAKSSASQLVSNYSVGPSAIRIFLMTFGDFPKLVGNFTSVATATQAIDALNRTEATGTRTSRALNSERLVIDTLPANSSVVTVVYTDGQSQDSLAELKAAADLVKQRSPIYVLATGAAQNLTQMQELASAPAATHLFALPANASESLKLAILTASGLPCPVSDNNVTTTASPSTARGSNDDITMIILISILLALFLLAAMALSSMCFKHNPFAPAGAAAVTTNTTTSRAVGGPIIVAPASDVEGGGRGGGTQVMHTYVAKNGETAAAASNNYNETRTPPPRRHQPPVVVATLPPTPPPGARSPAPAVAEWPAETEYNSRFGMPRTGHDSAPVDLVAPSMLPQSQAAQPRRALVVNHYDNAGPAGHYNGAPLQPQARPAQAWRLSDSELFGPEPEMEMDPYMPQFGSHPSQARRPRNRDSMPMYDFAAQRPEPTYDRAGPSSGSAARPVYQQARRYDVPGSHAYYTEY
eukprot:m.102617 g.102617  ORF g.102617 m.102617 type:complete len:1162 (-) comp15693_c0_seq1:41-3526(-)